MEIEAQLEHIDKKIESYSSKIDDISSLITTLIHTFQQNQMPNIKTELLDEIEKKLNSNSSLPDVEELKKMFSQLKYDIQENQNGLTLKIIELETLIKKTTKAIENISQNNQDSKDEALAAQLSGIENILSSLSKELSAFTSIQNLNLENISTLKLEDIKNLFTQQSKTNTTFQKVIENKLDDLSNKVANLTITADATNDDGTAVFPEELKEKFEELNLSIVSIISFVKIIDKKIEDFNNYQSMVDGLAEKIISPILKSNQETKDFLKEYISNSFTQKISEISNNPTVGNFEGVEVKLDSFSEGFSNLIGMIDEFKTNTELSVENLSTDIDNVSIDVNKILTIVNDFKTNSDLSNQTISDSVKKFEEMLLEYNKNLSQITVSGSADHIKEEVKVLNDDFYVELLDLFNSLSFDEEAEDIKDFIENVLSAITTKTVENSEKINDMMLQVKQLLHKIEGIEQSQNNISHYLKSDEDGLDYSFDDIQSDLAKMRLVLNDISQTVTSSEIVEEISDKIKYTNEQIENVSRILGTNNGKDETVIDLRQKVENLNEQINDISMRTNKLLLSNEDSTIELKNNLELFKDVFEKANPEKIYELFYELTHYFNDTNEKISGVNSITLSAYTETKNLKNALIYIGEWADSATVLLEELRKNSIELTKRKDETQKLAAEIKSIKSAIKEDMTTTVAKIKANDDSTQKRLDKIEAKLDKLLAIKATKTTIVEEETPKRTRRKTTKSIEE